MTYVNPHESLSELTFTVDLAAAFAAGVPCPTAQPVTLRVDPTKIPEAARAVIAARLDPAARVRSRCAETGGLYSNLIVADAPTVEALVLAIQTEDEAHTTYADRRAAAKAADAAKLDARGRDETANPYTTTKRRWLVLKDTGAAEDYDYEPCRNPHEVGRTTYEYAYQWYGAYAARHEDGRRVIAAAEKAGETNRHDARAAAERTLVAADQPRRDWIAAHGSQRLKTMLAEKIGHTDTYNKEHDAWTAAEQTAELAAKYPGWTEVDPRELRTALADVPEAALVLLAAARRAILVDYDQVTLAQDTDTEAYLAVCRVTLADGTDVLIGWPQD